MGIDCFCPMSGDLLSSSDCVAVQPWLRLFCGGGRVAVAHNTMAHLSDLSEADVVNFAEIERWIEVAKETLDKGKDINSGKTLLIVCNRQTDIDVTTNPCGLQQAAAPPTCVLL